MAAHVGLDPVKDIHWVTDPSVKPIELFATARSMRSWAFRPSRRICAPGISATSSSTAPSTARGRSISAACWPATAEFVRKHPVATKRVLRAILKADRPLRHRSGARRAAARRWRFHPSLRLCAADAAASSLTTNGASTTPRTRSGSTPCACTKSGMIKSSPQKIIADGTDWRFLERAQTRAEGVKRKGREASNADDADPTPLSDHAVTGRRRRPPAAAARVGRPSRRWRPPPSASRRCRSSVLPRNMSARSCCAPRGLPMSATWTRPTADAIGRSRRAASSISHSNLSLDPRHRDRCRRADHRCSPACMPAATSCSPMASIRGIADLKGKSVGMRRDIAQLISTDGRLCRARPEKGHHPGRRSRRQAFGAVRRGQARRVSGVSARSRRNLHARKVGHVIVRTAVDRPWSQYFCCMLAATGNMSHDTRSRRSA